MDGIDIFVGDGSSGFSYASLFSTIFNTAGELTEGAGAFAKGEQDASAKLSETQKQTQVIIDADNAATAAIAKAAMTQDLASRDPKKYRNQASKDAAAADAADKVQDSAGLGTSIDKAQRLAVAQHAFDTAPNDIVKGAAARTLKKAQGGDVPELAKDKKKDDSADVGFLSRPVVGPVKVWMALVGALGAVGAAVVLTRKKGTP